MARFSLGSIAVAVLLLVTTAAAQKNCSLPEYTDLCSGTSSVFLNDTADCVDNCTVGECCAACEANSFCASTPNCTGPGGANETCNSCTGESYFDGATCTGCSTNASLCVDGEYLPVCDGTQTADVICTACAANAFCAVTPNCTGPNGAGETCDRCVGASYFNGTTCLGCTTDTSLCVDGEYLPVCDGNQTEDVTCTACAPNAFCGATPNCTGPDGAGEACSNCTGESYFDGSTCRACTNDTVCNAGEYLPVCDGSQTADAICTVCDANVFCTSAPNCTGSGGAGETCHACRNTSYFDGSTCVACSDSSTCPAGNYRPSCNGTQTADPACVACDANAFCAVTPNCTGAGGVGEVCNQCVGASYFDGASCVACSNTACPAGQYMPACNGSQTADPVCAACDANAFCASAVNCTGPGGLNETCHTCTGASYFDGATCLACSNSPACPDGSYRPVCNGTQTADPVCAACDANPYCASGLSCTGPGGAGETCSNCTGASFFDNTTCVACSTPSSCPAGTYLPACNGSQTADPTCTACDANPFCSTTPNCTGPGGAGEACTQCINASYFDGLTCVACDANPSCASGLNCTGPGGAGEFCASCRPGSFIDGDTCSPCGASCSAGTYVVGCNGTTTFDPGCAPCAANAFCVNLTCTGGGGLGENCTSCRAGSYIDGNTCTACSTSCPLGNYRPACVGNETADPSCQACAPVDFCAVTVNCTNGGDSQCAACMSGYLRNSGGAADVCDMDPNHCPADADANAYPCDLRNISATCSPEQCDAGFYGTPGTYTCQADGNWTGGSPCTACTVGGCTAGNYRPACFGNETADPVCQPCTPIANCASGLTCTTAADSQCAVCDDGYDNVDGTVDTCELNLTYCPSDADEHATNCSARAITDTCSPTCEALYYGTPGTYTCQSGPAWSGGSPCTLCTTGGCGAEQYRPPCTGGDTSDPSCAACDAIANCQANQVSCSSLDDESCAACEDGYDRTAGPPDTCDLDTTYCPLKADANAADCGTRSIDATCSPTCVGGYYRNASTTWDCDAPGVWNNGVACAQCQANALCSGGLTCTGAARENENCGGGCVTTAYDDGGVCTDCATLNREDSSDGTTCGQCQSGYFNNVDGDASANSMCNPCRTSCSTTEYLGTCTRTSNAVCAPCAGLRRQSNNGLVCGPCIADHYAFGSGGSADTTPCTSCACPSVESYNTGACTKTAPDPCPDCGDILNRQNGPDGSVCGTCRPNYFRPGDGDSNAATYCDPHATDCGVGLFPSAPGTLTANTTCTLCSAIRRDAHTDGTQCGPCDSDSWLPSVGGSSGTSTCNACTVDCPDGQYPAFDCTRTSDDTCPTCASLNRDGSDGTTCGACDSSHFRAGDGDSPAVTACTPCRTSCGGSLYVLGTCGGTTFDEPCPACGSINRVAGDGVTCGPCGPSSFRAGDGDASANTMCAACRTTCAPSLDQYLNGTCGGGTDDNQCYPCSALHREDGDGVTCGPCDSTHWNEGDGDISANTMCLPCLTPAACGTGLTLAGECGGTTVDSYCTACSAIPGCQECTGDLCDECSTNYFLTSRTCSECTRTGCPDGEHYPICEGTETTDAVCTPCSANCKRCTSTSTCTECFPGYYKTGGACVACNTAACNPWEYRADCPGTTTVDAGCRPCTETIPSCVGCDTSDECFACSSPLPYVKADGKACVAACEAGEFDDAGHCRPCPAGCDLCAAVDVCDQCSVGNVLTAAFGCAPACPVGEFDDGANRTNPCTSCSVAVAGCVECTGTGACQACGGATPFLSADGASCVATCGMGAVASDGQCEAVPCPPNSSPEGACACDRGYAAADGLAFRDGEWVGVCQRVPCPINSEVGAGGDCVCTISGTLGWSGTTWNGTCAAPDASTGDQVVTTEEEAGGGGGAIIAVVFILLCCVFAGAAAAFLFLTGKLGSGAKTDKDFDEEELEPIAGDKGASTNGSTDLDVVDASFPEVDATPKVKKPKGQVGKVYGLPRTCMDLNIAITPEKWWSQPSLAGWLQPMYDFSGRDVAYYAPLTEMLCDRGSSGTSISPMARLLDAVHSSQRQKAVEAIVATTPSAEGLKVLKEIISIEIGNCATQETLFRTDSTATKLFRLYATSCGIDFVRGCVGDQTQQMVAEATEEGELKDDESNVDSLAYRCQSVMQGVYSSKNRIPQWMLDVLHHVHSTAENKYPGSGMQAIGGFFFLRMLAPAITTPESFFIIDGPPSGPARKYLVDAGKVLVALANGVRFKPKQGDITKLNPFLDYNTANLNKFYEELLDMYVDDTATENDPVPSNITRLNALEFLHNLAATHKNAFNNTSVDADAVLGQLSPPLKET